MGSMARRNPANKGRLAQLGMCEKILPLYRCYGGVTLTRGAASVSLTEALCWSIAQLGYPDRINQGRLGVAGAHEVVCEALHRISLAPPPPPSPSPSTPSPSSSSSSSWEWEWEALLEEALRALHGLACSHGPNALLLFHWTAQGEGGEEEGELCATLTCLLRQHRDRSAVLQWIWYAVGSLCADLTFLRRFGERDICALAVDALVRSGSPFYVPDLT